MTQKFGIVADAKELESGQILSPKFNKDGLVTAVVTDYKSGELLMVAHMNDTALQKTLETGQTWLWSRSRQSLWLKGESSGSIQNVVEARLDCDQDAIWLKVKRQKAEDTCHTGRKSCFYRRIVTKDGDFRLEFAE